MNKIYILLKNDFSSCAEGQDFPYQTIIAACGENDKDKLYARLPELNKFAEKALECSKEVKEWNVSHAPYGSYKEECLMRKSIYNKYGFHGSYCVESILSAMYEIKEVDNNWQQTLN